MSAHLHLGFTSYLFPFSLFTETLCIFLFSSKRATLLAHFFDLDLFTLVIIHELCRTWASFFRQFKRPKFFPQHPFLELPQVIFIPQYETGQKSTHSIAVLYTRVNKNPSAWNFLSPKPEVTCGTVAIIIRVVLLSPYLRIRAVCLSSIHYNQSHRVYINRRRQYISLIWN